MNNLPEDLNHILIHSKLLSLEAISKMKGFKYKKVRERKLNILKEHIYKHAKRINETKPKT